LLVGQGLVIGQSHHLTGVLKRFGVGVWVEVIVVSIVHLSTAIIIKDLPAYLSELSEVWCVSLVQSLLVL